MSPAGSPVSPLQVGDTGPHQGVIVDVLPGDVYVEVLAFGGTSLGQYEVIVYTRGPRGGIRRIERVNHTDELRATADRRLRAADSADDYMTTLLRRLRSSSS